MFTAGNRGSYLFSCATYIRAVGLLLFLLPFYFLLSSPHGPLSNSRRMPEKASLILLGWELWQYNDTASKISAAMLVLINWWSTLMIFNAVHLTAYFHLKNKNERWNLGSKSWKKTIQITHRMFRLKFNLNHSLNIASIFSKFKRVD